MTDTTDPTRCPECEELAVYSPTKVERTDDSAVFLYKCMACGHVFYDAWRLQRNMDGTQEWIPHAT